MALIPAKGVYSDKQRVFPDKERLHTMSHTVNLDYVPGVREVTKRYGELRNSIAGFFDFARTVREVPENGYSAELMNELTDTMIPRSGVYRMAQSPKSPNLSQEDLEKMVYRKALDTAVKDVENEGYKVHFKSKEEMKREFGDEKGYEIGRDIYVCFDLPELEKLYVLGHERTGKNYRDHMANHEKIRAAEKPFAEKYVSKAMEYFLNANSVANIN